MTIDCDTNDFMCGMCGGKRRGQDCIYPAPLPLRDTMFPERRCTCCYVTRAGEFYR